MDFEVKVGEVLLKVRVRNPTSGGVPIEISNLELGKFDFPVEVEHLGVPIFFLSFALHQKLKETK